MQRGEFRSLGPVCLKNGHVLKQLLGLLFVATGAQILTFAYDQLLSLSPSGFTVHVLFGSFVAFNGLYLAGFRFRAWPTADESAA